MINYKEQDMNMPAVKRAVGRLDRYDLARSYRVFGLKQDTRPPVLIRANGSYGGAVEDLVGFFRRNGLQVMVTDGGERHDVYIGLRLDVRNNPRFAAAVIKTVIGRVEGRLALSTDFTVPGASSFASVDERAASAALSEE